MKKKERYQEPGRRTGQLKAAGGAFLAVFLCFFMTGCGRQDAALVISKGSSMETEEAKEGTAESLALHDQTPDENTEPRIYVYVCGAVQNPGVVELPEGSRAEDALLAAGGFSQEAQTDFVNLAAKVSDGEKLYFPDREEAGNLEAAEREAAEGIVNINTAGEALLCTLPGIGEARARDIVAYREEHGGFANKEDIMRVPGIKENAYEKLKDKITVE